MPRYAGPWESQQKWMAELRKGETCAGLLPGPILEGGGKTEEIVDSMSTRINAARKRNKELAAAGTPALRGRPPPGSPRLRRPRPAPAPLHTVTEGSTEDDGCSTKDRQNAVA